MRNVFHLGVKELWSLIRDPMMLGLIAFAFTFAIYIAATAMPETLNNAAIAIVDEDRSPLSGRIVSAFYPPSFSDPELISLEEVDAGLDAGEFTFVLDIPASFQRDVIAGRRPAVQLNVDATRLSQAFAGSGYVQQIVMAEVAEFTQEYRGDAATPVQLALRMRFNPSLDRSWFGGLMEVISMVTTISIVLTGTALIREREHGTIDHLLVMPVTPTEIMLSKVWSMGLVVLAGTAFALAVVIEGVLEVPVEGSRLLFLLMTLVHLFSMTSLGIFMATVARTMPQFGMLLVLVLVPLQLLSGGVTPRESMPPLVQDVMLAAPTTHFVAGAQAILYRGAGLEVVWPQLLAIVAIGVVLFGIALGRFRRRLTQMA